MGKKYSINSAGRIVAERDIYSLGGFIPKGTVGASIADETQLSQEGDCWVNAGDLSTNPWITVSGNSYIGNLVAGGVTANKNPIRIDGDTLIPGAIRFYHPGSSPTADLFIKDSFIGFDMDVSPGPRTTATAFPFEQGGYLSTAPRGTAFSSSVIQTGDTNLCRSTDAVIRCGLNTYVYLPTGYSGRILWAYTEGGTAVYSGESKVIPSGLTKIEHPVYKQFMLHINKINGTAMTPADLLGIGAKILGHVYASAPIEIRAGSASGSYTMARSSLTIKTDVYNPGVNPIRLLDGWMYNTNCVTETRTDIKIFGRFNNVKLLEFLWYIPDSQISNGKRDTFITASDCPLLRLKTGYVFDDLGKIGDLVLRRCVVPKAAFAVDKVDGNTYEDIDFSYTNEFMGTKVSDRTYVCSHKQGLYTLYSASGSLTGRASYPDNTKDATGFTEGYDIIPLDGDLIEQGSYVGTFDDYYEDSKNSAENRVRIGRPLTTYGAKFPSLPSGFKVTFIVYLRDDFKIQASKVDPTTIDLANPYFVMVFGKTDNSSISPSEFSALNASLTMSDYTKVPEITGSAYVGTGCIVRGDVQLHGDPYVNRVFDVNMWERGTTQDGDLPNYPTWEDRKIPTGVGNRFRFVDAFEVEPGGTFSCAEGYLIHLYRFDGSGKWIGQAGWATSQYIPEGETRFAGLIIKKATNISDAGGLITEEDLALANVKYLRAFKKRRYITNELDRKSPEDILLDTDMWEQGYLDRIAGKTYEELKSVSSLFIRLRRLINTGKGAVSSRGAGFDNKDVSFDGFTKCVTADDTIVDGTPLYGATVYKVPLAAISVADVVNSRFVVEFVPSPRIIALYDSPTIEINGTKVRMYDNSVLSKTLRVEGKLILKDDAVARYDYGIGECLCANGHSDAIIKLP